MSADTPSNLGQPNQSFDLTLLNKAIERFKAPPFYSFTEAFYLEDERNYKLASSDRLHTKLSKEKLNELINNHDFAHAAKLIKSFPQGDNLIFKPYELNPILNAPDEALARSLYNLLYGDQTFTQLFNAWITLLNKAKPRCWPAATYFLMLHDPANHIFIKPGPTASFLKSIGSPLTWQPHTTAAFYTQFQALAKAILPHLSPLGAQDMIDVQSFIWILRPLSEKEKSSRLNQIVKDDLKAVEEENSDPTSPGFPEGQKTTTLVSKYERDARNRAAAIQIHGTTCQACGFNFQQFYGSHGQDYIEVHHLQPLASYKSSIKIDPATDLAVLCANCHRMIHRHPQSPLTLEQLRHLISQAKAQP